MVLTSVFFRGMQFQL
uniref:Uncharacterized protein n=1 Tax=Arundo donax TaxID=35708 RepID=A0A0A9BN93_ARUDO